MSGIADLVYRDKQDQIHILDGKNATTPGKYEDEDQLRWYALCFRLQYGKMPHRLGFFTFDTPQITPLKISVMLRGNIERIGRASSKLILISMTLRDSRQRLSKPLRQSIEECLSQTLSPSTVRCAPMSQFVKNDKPKSRETQLKEA